MSFIRPVRFALWAAIAAVLSPAGLGQGIPGLLPVPDTLPAQERASFEQQRLGLQAELQGFLAAANAFNARKAQEQTDADYNELVARRARCVASAKAFNAELASAVAAVQPHGDPRVVDARGVPSGLRKDTEEWLQGISPAAGVYDRLRKGWEAYAAGDMDVAAAWFEDALNHDPGNPELRRVVSMMRKQRDLGANPAFGEALGRAADASGSAADRQAAVARAGEARGVLVLPAPGDEAFLFDMDPAKAPVAAGDVMPSDWPGLRKLLDAHPECRPQLEAAWREEARLVEKAQEDSVAKAVESLKSTAAQLGLPYGHIEETVARDPVLKAKWDAAVRRAAATSNMDDLRNLEAMGPDRFQETLLRLSAQLAAKPGEIHN